MSEWFVQCEWLQLLAGRASVWVICASSVNELVETRTYLSWVSKLNDWLMTRTSLMKSIFQFFPVLSQMSAQWHKQAAPYGPWCVGSSVFVHGWHHGGKSQKKPFDSHLGLLWICGTLLKGKNPTNLKVNLKSLHKKANLAYLDKVREIAQPPSPEMEANARPGSMKEHMTTVSQKTRMQCFHRRPDSCWLVNTQEHHKREDALVNMHLTSEAELHTFCT